MVWPAAAPVRPEPRVSRDVAAFARRCAVFLLIGLIMYLGCYAAAEALVYRYGHANRFFVVRATPASRFDYVILGASHAAVFDYRDTNERLQQLTGARIMNLAVTGGGVTVNKLLLDYFLTRHRTDAILYVVDSFAFYSAEWNERRLDDRRLFARAPFDPALGALLLASSATRMTAVDYLTGFSKINNPDRFKRDVPVEEGARFDRRYRAIPQIDRERIAYLYPSAGVDAKTFAKYLAEFDMLVQSAQSRGIAVLAIKPPIPKRFARLIPGEAEFDKALEEVARRRGITIHDFSDTDNDEAFFQDSDHLNRQGVQHFYESSLGPLLAERLRAGADR